MTSKPDHRLVQLDRSLHAVGAVIACAILVGGLVLVRRSLAAERTSIDARIAEARQILDKEDALHTEHSHLEHRLSDLERRTGELLARIPETPREAEFLAQLSGLAGESQLAIRSYRPDSPVESERYQRLDIELVAEGTFTSLCRFLEGLESLPRLSRLTHLEVESASAEDGTYPVTMTLRIFFAPEHAVMPESAAAPPAS